MIYNLSFFSDIAFSIKQALRTFSCKVATILYDWIIDLYNVFMYTARAEILSNEFIQKIYNKVGMILGIFMVFKLAFSLIQALVDPNKFTDGKNGFASIIKRSVIAIVLLGITPSLFRTAFQFQNLIAGTENNTDNLIYKLIVGDAPSHSADSFGRIIASKLYFGFYKENEPYKLDNGIEIVYPDSGGSVVAVDNYENLVNNVTNGTKQFSDTVDYLSITSSGQYVIDWNGLFAIAMALVMIWILVTYCIQVATRVVQLAYLQLVAPVPILSYISDPEGAFKNWTKQCLTTYLDLFIRLAIIYFVITVSTQILEAWDDPKSILYQSTGLPQDSSTMFWVVMFLIIGLLMFVKRVPELLKDLFPNLGGGAASLGFGVKSPKKLLNDIPGYGFAKGAATFGAGAVIGGIAGVATGIKHGEGFKGKLAGAFGGFNRGAASARTKGNIFKNAQAGMNSTRAARQRAYEKNHDGSTFWGRNFGAGGAARTKDEFDRELSAYKDYDAQVSIIDKELEKNEYVQQAMAEKENLMRSGTASVAQIQAANDKIKQYKESVLQTEMSKRAAGDPTANANISAALTNAEKIRQKGYDKGYKGFDGQDVSLDADAFNKNKKSSRNETNEITSIGGNRHEKYKQAEANAKYKKSGK